MNLLRIERRVPMLSRKQLTSAKPLPAEQTLKKASATIEFDAVGTSKSDGKFLRVKKGDKHVVLSVRNLTHNPKVELERLEELNINLIVPAAQNDFLKQAQSAAGMEPTFQVATKIGW